MERNDTEGAGRWLVQITSVGPTVYWEDDVPESLKLLEPTTNNVHYSVFELRKITEGEWFRCFSSGRNYSKSSRFSNGASEESGASTGPPSCIPNNPSEFTSYTVCTGIPECHRITLTHLIRRDFDCPPRWQNVHERTDGRGEGPPTTVPHVRMRARLTSHILHACGQTDNDTLSI